MAATSTHTAAFTKPSSFISTTKPALSISRFTLPFSFNIQKPTLRITNSLPKPSAAAASTTTPTTVTTPETIFHSRFAPDEPRKGADILVEALERQGVTDVFAYPGGASMEIHQALTRSNVICNVVPPHEQGGVFAVEGYAHSSGKPGVCITTTGPGATNLVSGLAEGVESTRRLYN